MKARTLIVTGLSLSLLGLVGVNRFVSATPPTKSAVAQPMPAQSQEKEANDGDQETNDDAKDQQELKQLQALAKITPQQAQQAAIATQPGTVTRVQLENEDGNLVYTVAIGQKEVKVDAGNGKVLYAVDAKSENDGKAHPRSSIQVSEPADGDRETKDDQR
jgi:Peptidase propeptide and YPEB domain